MTAIPFLQRTLDLAANSLSSVFVGPYVGWVLAHNNVIQYEGWLKEKDSLANYFSGFEPQPNQQLFLNINPFKDQAALESFCRQHFIKECFLATKNQSLSAAAYHLNRRYLTWQQQKRPYIILKWAQTADGFIARPNYEPYWISNALSRKLVHQWRSEEAAIWAGKNTYLHDNPRLNVRDWTGKDPVRIIIDKDLSLNPQWHVFDQSQPTLCYNFMKNEINRNLEYIKIALDKQDWLTIVSHVFNDLHQRNIQSLFVEGGSVLLNFLIQQNLWDEARVFTSPQTFTQGVPAPSVDKKYLSSSKSISDDKLTTYHRASQSSDGSCRSADSRQTTSGYPPKD